MVGFVKVSENTIKHRKQCPDVEEIKICGFSFCYCLLIQYAIVLRCIDATNVTIRVHLYLIVLAELC